MTDLIIDLIVKIVVSLAAGGAVVWLGGPAWAGFSTCIIVYYSTPLAGASR